MGRRKEILKGKIGNHRYCFINHGEVFHALECTEYRLRIIDNPEKYKNISDKCFTEEMINSDKLFHKKIVKDSYKKEMYINE